MVLRRPRDDKTVHCRTLDARAQQVFTLAACSSTALHQEAGTTGSSAVIDALQHITNQRLMFVFKRLFQEAQFGVSILLCLQCSDSTDLALFWLVLVSADGSHA